MPSIRFNQVIIVYIAFDAAAAAGTASAGTSGQQAHFVHACLVLQLCVHHLLETSWIHLLSLYCYATLLPIPQHGVLKDLPSFVTVCTPQGLAVKGTCMQDCRRRISPACIGQELLPFQLSTVYCAPPGGSTRKPRRYCLAPALLFTCFLC